MHCDESDIARFAVEQLDEVAVRYLRPVPVGVDLVLRGRVLGRDGQRWRLGAERGEAGADRLLATGEGTWLVRGPEHWERHQALVADRVNPSGAEGASATIGR